MQMTIAAPVSYFGLLTSVSLQHNRLTDLPAALWQLSRLEELNLGHNALRVLPSQVGQLRRLRRLYVHDNQLSELPRSMGALAQLCVLDLTGNQLAWLPSELAQLHAIEQLWIEHNPCHDRAPRVTACVVPSLRDLCFQLAGPTLKKHDLPDLLFETYASRQPNGELDDDDDNGNGNGNDDAEQDGKRGARCAVCQCKLYFPGIALLDHSASARVANIHVPLLYHVCSQACRAQWLSTHVMPS
ncbi:hypothetical protein BC940DRAFT_320974 [Gongronella butleri]|nr:hypothetical protein BC940DRAFT_320974 [Gongronella butleri]